MLLPLCVFLVPKDDAWKHKRPTVYPIQTKSPDNTPSEIAAKRLYLTHGTYHVDTRLNLKEGVSQLERVKTVRVEQSDLVKVKRIKPKAKPRKEVRIYALIGNPVE